MCSAVPEIAPFRLFAVSIRHDAEQLLTMNRQRAIGRQIAIES
jgi:hypothetical protein